MFLCHTIFNILLITNLVNCLQEKKVVVKKNLRSVYKKYLKGHVYKTTTQAADPQHCLSDCWKENDRCRSFNYFPDTDVCELNEGSEETHPEDLIDRPGIVHLTNPVFGSERVCMQHVTPKILLP